MKTTTPAHPSPPRPCPRPEPDWQKLCAELRSDLDFPVLLELQAALGHLPES
jgi:hypothetical protein